MKPPPFDYEAPTSLDEALALLAERGADGKVLAGGQSLVPLLNFRLARPEVLIDVNGLQELSYLRREEGALRIGALTRHAALEHSRLAASYWPLLTEAMGWVAHPQIRNRGTVGGSCAHADPAAELPVVMTALDARFKVRSTRGERVLSAGEMFVGQLEPGIEADELLVEIEVPPVPAGTGTAFLEFARRHGDFALGGAAAMVELDPEGICRRAAISLLGAGPTPLRPGDAEAALVGAPVDQASVAEAARLAVRDAGPTGDLHGSAEYRRDLIETLTRRALLAAGERAGGGDAR
ncbi:MAG: xanthine dehydrogenase family protein subunit M [Actinobacteria bacterium]|nr:xanthine dehydrogenase family protein subunit M [Actinomycetota bacterium]